MANDSIDHYRVLSETDLFSTMSISDHSIIHDDHQSSITQTKKFSFNNSKQIRNSLSNLSINEQFHIHFSNMNSISINQMLKTQNSNSPWLFNILTKKFHRTVRKSSQEIEMNSLLAEKFLAKQISNDGSNGRWIITEKEFSSSLMKNFDENHISSVISSSDCPLLLSTDDSLHLHQYHYNLPLSETPVIEDFISMIKTYYIKQRQLTNSNNIQKIEENDSPSFSQPIMNELQIFNENSQIKSTSSSRRQHHRHLVKKNSRKNKSKYYQERHFNFEEMQLRESLRLIDLDNIGFFTPNQMQKVFKEIGLHSHQIEKIERCLPLDDDGHYSIDNLVKLLLS